MRRPLLVAVLFAALASGCSGGGTERSSVSDGADFAEALEAAGFTVEESAGNLSGSPFAMARDPFEHTLTRMGVGTHEVRVFEFPDDGTAAAAAEAISPDGWGVAGGQYEWVASPHFWRSGRIIVLYLGDDGAFIGSITQILGSQFAGN